MTILNFLNGLWLPHSRPGSTSPVGAIRCGPPERRYLPQSAGEAEAGREDQLRPATAEDANGVIDRPLPGAQAADGDRDHGERQDVLVALARPAAASPARFASQSYSCIDLALLAEEIACSLTE